MCRSLGIVSSSGREREWVRPTIDSSSRVGMVHDERTARLRRVPLPQDPVPAVAGDPFLLRLGPDRWRELLAPFPGPGRVDDQAAVEPLLARLDRWIERTAPGAMDYVQVAVRVGA